MTTTDSPNLKLIEHTIKKSLTMGLKHNEIVDIVGRLAPELTPSMIEDMIKTYQHPPASAS